MPVTIDLPTATQIVQQLYPGAADPLMTLELESTVIGGVYRPYLVAAKLIMTEYRQIVKADVVTFQYSDDLIKNLLNRQKDIDTVNGVSDPVLAAMITELCTSCDSIQSLGVTIV